MLSTKQANTVGHCMYMSSNIVMIIIKWTCLLQYSNILLFLEHSNQTTDNIMHLAKNVSNNR